MVSIKKIYPSLTSVQPTHNPLLHLAIIPVLLFSDPHYPCVSSPLLSLFFVAGAEEAHGVWSSKAEVEEGK